MEIKKIKEYEFEVRGKTDIYTIIHRKDKTWFCTCKAFQYQTNGCKHIEVVKQWQIAQRNTKHLVELTTEELNVLYHRLNVASSEFERWYHKISSKHQAYAEDEKICDNIWDKINNILNGGK